MSYKSDIINPKSYFPPLRVLRVLRVSVVVLCLLISQTSQAWADGPKAPRVLWVHKAAEHFVASPVTDGKHLYVSGIGLLNSGAFHALSLEPQPASRIAWSKTPPYLKVPTVSAPAVAEELVLFGDGMHQTDGAVLHCLTDGGQPVWQLAVPGRLVHLEGTPLVQGDKVFIGAGSGGVLCADLRRFTLEGKEMPLAEAQVIRRTRWDALTARYELDKKTDPDFAFPPSEDDLPRLSPKLLWQVGQNRWHVDASLAMSGKELLAASAYLDVDREGERAIYCLKPEDGSVIWKAPLTYNPWGTPAVAGGLAIVGTSSVRMDPAEVSGAKGEVLALRLDSGAVEWRRELPTGVVSSVAIAGELAVSTATDGQVRAWKAATGDEVWSYSAGSPLFAGAVVTAESVYTGGLNGTLHAIAVKDGAKQWTLNVGDDPAIKTPGMFYGTPLWRDGRLYAATCNLAGHDPRPLGVVVCIGEN